MRSCRPGLLARAAREAGLKVILTGEGGDELFAGYGRYRSVLRPWWAGGRRPRARGVLDDLGILRGEIAGWRDGIAAAEARNAGRGRTPLQVAQAVDCADWLPNDLLIKLDRCLMAHGAEGRTPYLDTELAALAFRLPDELKIQSRARQMAVAPLARRAAAAGAAARPQARLYGAGGALDRASRRGDRSARRAFPGGARDLPARSGRAPVCRRRRKSAPAAPPGPCSSTRSGTAATSSAPARRPTPWPRWRKPVEDNPRPSDYRFSPAEFGGRGGAMNREFRRRDLFFGAAAAAAGAALPPGVAPMAKTGGAAASRDYADGNAADLVRALAARRISSVESTDAAIARIEALDKAINAVVVRDFDRARQAAKAADATLARGESGALLGLPMTVMDVFGVAGLPTTWGNPKFRDWRAPVDAPVISRLKAAGAVILGKTNAAGGAAAALAAGFVALELGSDSGGSLPCPAHFCGVFVHKPSRDLVPVCGGLAVAGPMARSAADLALELEVIAGPDEVPQGVGYKLALPPARHQDLPGFRLLVVDTHPLVSDGREHPGRTRSSSPIA